MGAQPIGTNWSGNYRYQARALHQPRTMDELCALVARAPRLRVLGSRHSFTSIGDSDELVSLSALDREVSVDREAGTIAVPGDISYAQLAEILNRHGRALHNLASLPHISVAGAVATATHGSGDTSGNLATAVAGIELVTSDGELRFIARGEDDFDGCVVGLGALGVLTRVVLETEPFYEVRQRVYEGLSWEALFASFDAVTGRGESVSVFHRFGSRTEQVWVKRRLREDPVIETAVDLFDAASADGPRNPVLGGDPANCTEQMGVPGPWSERLPHFRSGFTPSAGEEIQAELFVPRSEAVAALTALRALGDQLRPMVLVAEIRTMAADRLWLSPQYGQDTVGLHFTWRRRQAEVERLMGLVEDVLRPFRARPHWGKVFTARAAELEHLYDRMNDFRALRERLDPRGAFVNPWLRERILGPA